MFYLDDCSSPVEALEAVTFTWPGARTKTSPLVERMTGSLTTVDVEAAFHRTVPS